MNAQPYILAHRGYSSRYVENSYHAFIEALRYGADGVELDIHVSKNRRFYIVHDRNLSRLTSIDKTIDKTHSKQIDKLRLPNSEPIPRLEDFLTQYPKDRYINIELKETVRIEHLPELFSIIKHYLSEKLVIVSSFNHKLLPYFYNKKVKTAALLNIDSHKYKVMQDFLTTLLAPVDLIHISVNVFYIFPQRFITLVLKALRLFKKRISFYTVNSEEEFQLSKDYADFIITDEVERITLLRDKNTASQHPR